MKFLIIILLIVTQNQSKFTNQCDLALERIKSSPLLKTVFSDSGQTNINFYISDSVRYIDGQFFMEDVIAYNTGELPRGWHSADSLLYYEEFDYLQKMRKNFVTFKNVNLNQFSSQKPYDLIVEFCPYNESVLLAEARPYDSIMGFTRGISCIFFFNEDNKIVKQKFVFWEN